MTSRSKLFDRDGDDGDEEPDFSRPRPDLQAPKPMNPQTRKLLEFMKDGFDLLIIGTTPPVLIRNYSNGRALELIKCYTSTVQDARDRGYIEHVSGSVYEKVGWLCYGLTPAGRRLFE